MTMPCCRWTFSTVAATMALPCLLWWAMLSLPQGLCPAYGEEQCRCHNNCPAYGEQHYRRHIDSALLKEGSTFTATMALPCLRWATLWTPQWRCHVCGGQHCGRHNGVAILRWATLWTPQWRCHVCGGQHCGRHNGIAMSAVGNTVDATMALPFCGGQHCGHHNGIAMSAVGNTVDATMALPFCGGQHCGRHNGVAMSAMDCYVSAVRCSLVMEGTLGTCPYTTSVSVSQL